MRGAGLNGADVLQRRGAYPAPQARPRHSASSWPGRWWRSGRPASRFGAGDRVMAVVGGGGQAELAVVHERAAMPVPPGLDWSQAGGLPEAFTTAHDAFHAGRAASREHLLVHGGAGGVGSAAVQLGRAAGARVTATVRRGELREHVSGSVPRRLPSRASRAMAPTTSLSELRSAP